MVDGRLCDRFRREDLALELPAREPQENTISVRGRSRWYRPPGRRLHLGSLCRGWLELPQLRRMDQERQSAQRTWQSIGQGFGRPFRSVVSWLRHEVLRSKAGGSFPGGTRAI